MSNPLHLCPMILASIVLSGCGEPSPQSLKHGDELYAYYCKSCHAQKGMGPFLERLPLTSASLKRHEVVLMIKHGYPQGHSDMPVFSQLSLEQADAIAEFILQQRHRTSTQHN